MQLKVLHSFILPRVLNDEVDLGEHSAYLHDELQRPPDPLASVAEVMEREITLLTGKITLP